MKRLSENDRHDITAVLSSNEDALYMPLARALWEAFVAAEEEVRRLRVLLRVRA